MRSIIKTINDSRVHREITILNLVLFLFLFRTINPIFFLPFIISFCLFFLYFVINYRSQLLHSAGSFLRRFYLIEILIIVSLLSLLFSSKIFLDPSKEIINSLILLCFFFAYFTISESSKDTSFFGSELVYYFILFGLIISVLGFLDLINVYNFSDYILSTDVSTNPWEGTAQIDYNFAILPIFFGLMGIVYLLVTKTLSSGIKVIFYFLLLIFSINILLSGSRRGIFLFLLVIAVFFIIQFAFFLKRNSLIRKLRFIGLIYMSSLVIFFVIITLFFKAPYQKKNEFLQFIGCKNIQIVKTKVGVKIFRAVFLFNPKTDYNKIFNTIWSSDFDPRDPDSSWGIEFHKTVFPLTGKNVEIVPSGSKGYYIDSTCFRNPFPPNYHYDSHSMIANLKVKNNEKYSVSVYCFVSEDFDGTSARLLVGYKAIETKAVYDTSLALYDFNRKGMWQKMEIHFSCNEGEVPIYISFIRRPDSEFANMKGHVIFAYPEFKKLPASLSQSAAFPGSVYYSSIGFSGNILNIRGKLKSDSIRSRISNFISEDTTYYPPKNNLSVPNVENRFGSDRILRWNFAFQIFAKEYTWNQKLFGHGFDFLNWYGNYFFKDKTRSDYPHNPFLHILLYSGIFGLLIYCFFIYKAFRYYIQYIREYYLFFIFFLVTFFFTFFSSGGPFDPPLMGFFSILPYFIHAVHTKPGIV